MSEHDSEGKYKDLVAALITVRNRQAHADVGDHLSLGDRVVAEIEASGGFDFTAVGSLDNAMHTVRPFSSRPTLELINSSTPHDLVALKEQTILPVRLGFKKPIDFTDKEFEDVVSSYAGAELLDRERQVTQMNAEKSQTTENRKLVWDIVKPILLFLFGVAVTFLGVKGLG